MQADLGRLFLVIQEQCGVETLPRITFHKPLLITDRTSQLSKRENRTSGRFMILFFVIRRERSVGRNLKVSLGRRALVVQFGDMTVFCRSELWHRFSPDEERPVWHNDGHHALCA